ncbi:MAG: DeoR/GlpR family DNA-binding transcription regulator [Lachnospiraceae bacterium]|nr:DeoR/GlpR family DNA-binding transcription regulator [Lachnospiraceae bacterium]
MFQIERQEKILEYINKTKKANTNELANKFNVSKVTIRRDIDILASQSLIIKTHGGALALTNSLQSEIPYSYKAEHNPSAKKAIGIMASTLINDGDIIILDSGSTTLEIARRIDQKNITVVTDDIKIAMELSGKDNITVIVCGGTLSDPVYTLTGNTAVEFFSKLHVNKTFLGCDAVDFSFGISNRTYGEVDIKSAMIEAADEIIMVTDDSKLDKKVFCHLCSISKIDKLVINQIDERNRKGFTDSGVEIILADS